MKDLLQEAFVPFENWSKLVAKSNYLRTGVDLLSEIETIQEDGEALIVGGAVRDLLLGIEPDDIDIATNVNVNLIARRFKTADIGKSKSFGIVLVLYGGYEYEVANYRTDIHNPGQTDNRHPSDIRVAKSFEEDSARRDLTINALGIDKDGVVHDYHNGMEDLKNQIIKAVGDPKERFIEDALRIYRVLRMSSRFGFRIDPATLQAARDLVHLTDTLAVERVQEELFKAAKTGPSLAQFIEHLDDIGLLERTLPEIKRMQGMKQQPEHHPEGNVFSHTLSALRVSPSKDPLTNIAILFHDVGKTKTYENREGKHTYYGHDAAGAPVIDEIAKRMKMSNDVKNILQFVADRHMIFHKIRIKDVNGKLMPDERSPSKNKIIGLVNHPAWPILRDVAYADEMSTGTGDANEILKKFQDMESMAKQASAEKGQEGLRQRVKEFIDGNKLQEWIPEIKEKENIKFMSQILKQTEEWLVNQDFNVSPELVKQYAQTTYSNIKNMGTFKDYMLKNEKTEPTKEQTVEEHLDAGDYLLYHMGRYIQLMQRREYYEFGNSVQAWERWTHPPQPINVFVACLDYDPNAKWVKKEDLWKYLL